MQRNSLTRTWWLLHLPTDFVPKEKHCKTALIIRVSDLAGQAVPRMNCHHHLIMCPSTTGVVGTPQMNQFPPLFFFSVLHRPPGFGELKACPFHDVVALPLFLSALSSSPLHCAMKDGFGQTWWTGDMSILLVCISLDGQKIVWSDCLLGYRLPCW